ncbi:antitoxin VbhA family protein [Flavonifractor sp. An306]|uniref:antitoxin VbhA family protein n=1 Tax=Flavonifractor sp. An306 TaxID=1965629 RepID=UPI0023B9090B|nr:antitoxin VbhA family protein [Flavonifractor sp. An306]
MENAEASVRMEGYTVTPKMREQCKRVLRGEATMEECLKRFLKSRQKDDSLWHTV